MDRKIEEFRRRVLQRRAGRSRGARAYDDESREFALAHVERERARGRSLIAIAQDLGIAVLTLQAWQAAARPRGLVPVVLAGPAQSAGGLAVTTTGGLRVEGLDLDGVVALVRALG